MRIARLLTVLCLATATGCRPADIVITETPIRVVDERTGSGRPVEKGDRVTVGYRITLPNGKVVLDQDDYAFTVGTDSVIRGIDEAVRGMRTGGKRVFTCPPHKHWGRAGYGRGLIPPATDLTIELTLDRIVAVSRKRVGSEGGNG